MELDVYPDPQGGLFAGAAARKLAGEDGFLPIPALRQPGWKVSFMEGGVRLHGTSPLRPCTIIRRGRFSGQPAGGCAYSSICCLAQLRALTTLQPCGSGSGCAMRLCASLHRLLTLLPAAANRATLSAPSRVFGAP